MHTAVLAYIQAHGMLPTEPQAWLDAMNAARPFTVQGVLDIRFVDVGEDFVVLEMPITNASRQPYGLLHGGVSLLLAETAASGHATWKVDLRQRMPVGLEINGSHLRSATDGTVQAIGKVVQRSRNFIVHRVEIRHKESGRLLSVCRVTNFYKRMGQERSAERDRPDA